MCIIDCLSTIVFLLPLHLDYTKVIILILWWRNFQLEYWRTFQLVSTDTDEQNIRILSSMIDNENVNDALYDFLIKYRLTDWERCSDTVLFPVPYQSTLSIISSNNQSKELSIQKLEKYLKKEWYRGHSDCAWHDDHKYGIRHDGYWSFESGALVKVLGLDDTSLKGLPYYPYDMVHWNENKI